MQQAGNNPLFTYSTGRLIMMGVLSMILCVSVFMSIFTPFPVAFSSLLFGRIKGIMVATGASLTFAFLIVNLSGSKVTEDYTLIVFFVLCMVMAYGMSEIIHKNMDPIQSIFKLGLIVLGIISILLYGYKEHRNLTIEELVLENVLKAKTALEDKVAEVESQVKSATLQKDNEEAIAQEKQADQLKKQLEDLNNILKKPEMITSEIIKLAPRSIIIGVFVILWANMFLLLRSYKAVRKVEGNYSEKTLLNFKVPEQFIYGVIVGLILFLWGDKLGEIYPVIGSTMIWSLGVFYFFHGFGIYIAFLDHIRMFGFFRTILVVLTVLTASELIALVGVFDMFVNFRKYLKKNEELN